MQIGIGIDSHRFLEKDNPKKCIIAGIVFEDVPGLDADSDGDVVFHSITSALSCITHENVLGHLAPLLCKQGETNSRVYLEAALKNLKGSITSVAVAIEGLRPKFKDREMEMRVSVARVLQIDVDRVGFSFTTGDGLTSFGKGEGLFATSVIQYTSNKRRPSFLRSLKNWFACSSSKLPS
jgi:2-C-methyl-D-erythritol 2,4-cyclodiphosphate synthase